MDSNCQFCIFPYGFIQFWQFYFGYWQLKRLAHLSKNNRRSASLFALAPQQRRSRKVVRAWCVRRKEERKWHYWITTIEQFRNTTPLCIWTVIHQHKLCMPSRRRWPDSSGREMRKSDYQANRKKHWKIPSTKHWMTFSRDGNKERRQPVQGR